MEGVTPARGEGGGERLIEIRNLEGKGRGVVASKPLKGGEIVLKDSPLLIYSALPFHHPPPSSYCSNCFRTLLHLSKALPCSNCTTSLFCSHKCQSIAITTSHTPFTCQSLIRLTQYSNQLDEDRLVQARFLIAAYNLSLVSPSSFQTLMSLQGSSTPHQQPDDVSFHSLMSSLFPPHQLPVFSLELTSVLLSKDKLNAFGLMEPFSESKERSVRAYAIYPFASFFNHDCLPNACRFDYLDHQQTDSNNTDMVVRLIHDVPAGREICLSYFPVNLKYSQRQSRLRDDYGFTCDCDRCKVEANWSDEEEEDRMDELDDDDDDDDNDDNAVMEEDPAEHMTGLETGAVQGEEDFPHAYFFLRYMCDRNNCWGTLAPLPPSSSSAVPSTILECNVCGNLSNCNEA